ncbi:MAG: tautomerase family protein [Rhodobacteraceae bacterium]|uniref:tautomerase family protein n=1 Tax=Celeribacter sp. TaxID=1890673 RepID=UPI0017EB0ADC|nr:tautomerase family protein [Paracoccaceae bacterium]
MPFVTITTWKSDDDTAAERLMSAVTRAVHDATGAPLDKIAVVISEIPKSRWSEADVLATDPAFPTLSRRMSYEKDPT